MKKTRKRQEIFHYIVIILLLTVLLSSCQPAAAPSGDAGEVTEPAVENSEQPSDEQEDIGVEAIPSIEVTPTPTIPSELLVNVDDLDGVVIRFWHPWVDKMGGIVEGLATEFNQTNEWGIQVEVTAPGSNSEVYNYIRTATEKEGEKTMMEGAGVSIASGKAYLHATGTLDYGSPPHVFVAPMDHMLSLEENDIPLVDLSHYVNYPEYGLTDKDKADFPAVFWKYAKKGDKLYGIPAERSASVLFYNVTWAEELGFSNAPETIEEFKEQVCAAADVNNELAKHEGNTNPEDFAWDDQSRKVGTGGWIINMNTPETISWIKAFGDFEVPSEEGASYKFNNDETLAAFEFIQELYDQGCAWTSRNPDPYEYFANRQALFYSGSMPDILIQKNIFDISANPQDNEEDGQDVEEAEDSGSEEEPMVMDEWTVIPYPTVDGNPNILVTSLSYGMLESSPEEQLAGWLFIQWLSQPEKVAMLVEGNGTIPVRVSANNLLDDYASEYPQWEKTLGWVPMTFNLPSLSSWRVAGNILQDGAWHIFEASLPAKDISGILSQIDEMIPEVENELE